MPNLRSLLFRLLVGGMLILPSIVLAPGQETSPQLSDNTEARREWWGLAKGRTEFEVSDPAALPSRLILAARHSGSGCKIEEGLADSPVRFTKIAGRQLAIVFCPSIIGSHEVFDLTSLQRPRLIDMPFINTPEGFGTTYRPGWITREKDSAIFQAVTGSDLKSSWDVRHTYQFSGYLAFVVIRVEVKGMPGHPEWTTIWEAPRWTFPEAKQ